MGQRLWSDAEEQLRRAGFLDVTLWVLKENAGALRFYGANGFVDASVSRECSRRLPIRISVLRGHICDIPSLVPYSFLDWPSLSESRYGGCR